MKDEWARPLGKKLSEGCGRWNPKSSAKPLQYIPLDYADPDKDYGDSPPSDKLEWQQGDCKGEDCKRKPRLNRNKMIVEKFETRLEMLAFIRAKNQPEGLTLPSIEVPKPLGETHRQMFLDMVNEDRKDAEDEAEEMYYIDVAKGLV